MLRSRALYVVLGLLTVAFYAWSWTRHPGPLASDAASAVLDVPAADAPIDPPDSAAELFRAVSGRPGVVLWAALSALSVAAVVLSGFGVLISDVAAGRLRRQWRAMKGLPSRWSWGELARVLLLVVLLMAWLPFLPAVFYRLTGTGVDRHIWLLVAMLIIDGVAVAAILVFAGDKAGGLAGSLGLSPARVRRAVGTSFRAYLVAFPWLFVLLFAILRIADWAGYVPPELPIQDLIFNEHRPAVLAATVVFSCLVGPVAEECFFRGLLYPTLRGSMPMGVAMLITGALFAAIHANLLGFLPIVALGALFAYLYERTGSLAAPIAMHVLHNSLMMNKSLLVRFIMAGQE